MDGYELLRAIALSRSRRTIPAVAVSAFARPEDRARALAAGFIGHVAKPIDPLSLVRLLTATLSRPNNDFAPYDGRKAIPKGTRPFLRRSTVMP